MLPFAGKWHTLVRPSTIPPNPTGHVKLEKCHLTNNNKHRHTQTDCTPGACPDIFDRGGTRGGPPLTGHLANHILRYWGGQSDFRGGPCHPRPLPEHATAAHTDQTVGVG